MEASTNQSLVRRRRGWPGESRPGQDVESAQRRYSSFQEFWNLRIQETGNSNEVSGLPMIARDKGSSASYKWNADAGASKHS